MSNQNVFIATLPRSGSTLLGLMLGSHSRICHIGESAYWSKIDVHNTKCCCGTVGCGYLLQMSEMLSAHQHEVSAISDACGKIDFLEEPTKVRHHLSHSAPTASSESFEQTIQLCCQGLDATTATARVVFGKDVVVENTKYPLIAERLLQRAGWKVIALTRDPRGIALSNREAGRRKGVPRPVKDKIGLLLSFSTRVSEMMRNDNVLLVRYEDLCSDTVGTLDRACHFLGIRFESRMLEFKANKGHLLMGNHMMYDLNQKVSEDIRWHGELTTEEKSLFVRDDLIRAYRRLGYDLEKEI